LPPTIPDTVAPYADLGEIEEAEVDGDDARPLIDDVILEEDEADDGGVATKVPEIGGAE
jgi:hypothetical protein